MAPKKRIFAAFDVDHHENAKIEALSDAAYRSWHRLVAWCVRSTSTNPDGEWIDGLMPAHVFKARTTTKTARELLAGLVDRVGENYALHDYTDQQRSARDVIKLRKSRSEAGSKGGTNKKANSVANAKQDESKDVAVQEQVQEQEDVVTKEGDRYVPSQPAAATHPPGMPTGPRPDPETARCIDHRGVASPPRCGGCARAREATEAKAADYDTAVARAHGRAKAQQAVAEAEQAKRAAVPMPPELRARLDADRTTDTKRESA